ncbi:TetR/AcrR family transcriptional regulator [Eionea flava]
MSSDTIERIIQSAENQARTGGYHGFSFREIAKDIGIKSASIHYHFPTKTDLATELAKRYTEKFNGHLQAISDTDKGLEEQLSSYTALFYHAIKNDQKMCLCGLFAAESEVLPKEVQTATRQFFEAQIQWLTDLMLHHRIDLAEDKAIGLLANLEGAMLLAKTFDSEDMFTRAINIQRYLANT